MVTRPIPPARDEYATFQTITTRWFDNDIYGHMNNTVHYELFDTAVNGFLVEERVLDLRESPTVFLVVNSGCSYFSELSFPDLISAGLRVTKLGSSSVHYDIALFSREGGRAAARGHFVHVNVDRVTRRPVPLTDHARVVLGALFRAE
ncbi:acyl-CoA thioesterase [Celeribacter marinus]|uniref:acyl-CoA thioesterase n=1 Tax=Celeribacter marinus TaxID=1397108 RepID=UPI003F6C88B2